MLLCIGDKRAMCVARLYCYRASSRFARDERTLKIHDWRAKIAIYILCGRLDFCVGARCTRGVLGLFGGNKCYYDYMRLEIAVGCALYASKRISQRLRSIYTSHFDFQLE